MKQPIVILLLLIFCTSCDRMLRDMMHDAEPPEQKGFCGTVSPSQKANTVFQANCASCHQLLKDATGPALQGALSRWGYDTVRLKKFIKSSRKFIRTGDPYAVRLYKSWNKTEMTAFPDLTDKELNALLEYMK